MANQPEKTIEQAYAELVVNFKALQSIIAEQKTIHEGMVDRATNLRVQLDQYAEALRTQQEANRAQGEQIAVLIADKAALEKTVAEYAAAVKESLPAAEESPSAV